MNYAAKVWDFFWGALIAGTLPVIVFWSSWILAAGPFAIIISPVAALATLYFACRWRKQHRSLPIQIIFFEVLLGLAIGILFSVIMSRGFANLPS